MFLASNLEKPKENTCFCSKVEFWEMVSPKSRFLGDGFAQKSSFGWWFRPKVHFWVMVSPKSPFFGDGFAQKSSFGRWFRPKVGFWVTVSPKSRFLGDGFAQNGNCKFKIMQKCGKSGNRKIPVYFLYGRPIFPGWGRAGVIFLYEIIPCQVRSGRWLN